MNNIQNLENIGGNLITNQYYKFVGENMLNLGSEDYDILITNSNIINICFPMGIFGIVSPVYGFTKNDRIDLRTMINIINEYYNGVITEQERNILIEQSDEDTDLSIYYLRKDLLDYSNLCYFQGIEEKEGVYNILLGS